MIKELTAESSAQKSLLILNQVFYPDLDATGQLLTDLAEDLAKRKIAVSVICGRNRPEQKRHEVYRGVEIDRVAVLRLNKKILPFRYLNYLSFFPAVFFRAMRHKRTDYLLVVSSPPFMYLIGWLLKKIKRTKLVYNVQDLFPDVAIELGLIKSRPLIRAINGLNAIMLRSVEKIICIVESMASSLVAKGAALEKITVIHNWADGRQLFPLPRAENEFLLRSGLNKKFIVQYSGNIGMVHDIDTILATAERMTRIDRVHFVFIGDGVQARKIKELIAQKKPTNISLFPYQARVALNLSLNASDLSLVSLKNGFEGKVLPSKLYGIMAVGKPIIAICRRDSDVARIVQASACGRVIESGDAAGCEEAILELMNDPAQLKLLGCNARAAFMDKYDRPKQTAAYYQAIFG